MGYVSNCLCSRVLFNQEYITLCKVSSSFRIQNMFNANTYENWTTVTEENEP